MHLVHGSCGQAQIAQQSRFCHFLRQPHVRQEQEEEQVCPLNKDREDEEAPPEMHGGRQQGRLTLDVESKSVLLLPECGDLKLGIRRSHGLLSFFIVFDLHRAVQRGLKGRELLTLSQLLGKFLGPCQLLEA